MNRHLRWLAKGMIGCVEMLISGAVVLWFVMWTIPAAAACMVIGISDGDTMTVRCEDGDLKKIRIAEIDAPEKAQAFGQASKQALADLCFGRRAELNLQTKDRYGRTVARVVCQGRDVSAAQVSAGMAWVFDRYVTDKALYRQQAEARAAGRGQWAEQQPIAPWDWRQSKKEKL